MQDFHISDLPPLIPLLPLQGAVILANARLPVAINEYEYINIVDPAIKDYEFIGIVQPKNQNKENVNVYRTGCLAKLEDLREADDERYFALFSGVCRFDIVQEVDSDYKYRLAFVNYERFLSDLFKEKELNNKGLLKSLEGYLKTFDVGINLKDFKDSTANKLITAIAMVCPLSSNERQALIEASTETEQINIMKTLIEFAKHDTNAKHHLH